MTRHGSPIVRTLAVSILAFLFIGSRAPERPTTRWAVLIAASGTEEAPGGLDFLGDVQSIATVLRSSYGFENVFEIYNEEATLKGLYFGLEEMSSSVRPGDSVFLFVALPETDFARTRTPGLHWVPWDGRPEEGLALINPQDVISRLGQLDEANILLVSPNCIAEARYGYAADQRQMKVQSYGADSGTIFNTLSGCSRAPASGVFAGAVADGLESGLGKNLSEFTSEDLTTYLKPRLDGFRLNHQRQFSGRGSLLFVRERQALDPGLLESMEAADSAETRVDSIYSLVDFVFKQSQDQRGPLVNDLAGRLLDVTRGDISTAVRNAALVAIGRLKPDGVLEMLAEIARTDTLSVAVEAIRTIEQLGGSEAIELLEGLLDSERPAVRTGAIQALSRLNSTASLSRIIDGMAGDFDGETNLAALEAILLLCEDKEAAVASVVALLEREPGDRDVRREAISALGNLGQPSALPVLREWLQGGDKVLAAAAANALARIEAPANMRPGIERSLIGVLSDNELADAAARALGRHGSSAAVDPLLERATDPTTQARTRAAAINALGDIGDGAAVGPLIDAVWGDDRDPDRNVRLAACRALGSLGDAAALRPLELAAKGDDDLYVRGEAVKAVDRIREARVRNATDNQEVAALLDALGAADELTRSRAEKGLASLPADTVIRPLIAALEDDNPARRAGVVTVLGLHSDSAQALRAVLGAAKDEHASVRASVYSVLGRVADPQAVEILRAAAEGEKEPSARQAVAFSLIDQSNEMFHAEQMGSARELAELAFSVTSGKAHVVGAAEALITLAKIERTEGDLDAARKSLERARKIQESSFGPESSEVAEALMSLGRIVEEQGEGRYAEDLYFQMLGIQERVGSNEDLVEALENLAGFFERSGDEKSSLAFTERAEEARRSRKESPTGNY